MSFTFVDLFSGIGGFHQAVSALGGNCVLSCDIDKKARETYLKNYKVPYFHDDIATLKKELVPDHDLLMAGFPCQPFSISGHHKALDDTRASVIEELIRVIREKRPSVFILENVKHILHIQNGQAFRHIIEGLQMLGYKVTWETLNASAFGLAQNRERVFIVGTLNQPFDFSKVAKNETKIKIRDILEAEGEFEFLNEKFTLISNPVHQKSGLLFVGYRNKKIRKAGVRENTEHLSRVHKQPNRIYSVDGVHPTLPSQESSGRFWILLDNGKVRKLTLRECYRLMGFPNDFKNTHSSGTQYIQIGNSVCIPVVTALVSAIIHEGHLNNANEYRFAV